MGQDNSFHSAYFTSLLEKNKKRARGAEDESGIEEVPSLQLGLGDLAKRVRELGTAGGAQTRKESGVDSKA